MWCVSFGFPLLGDSWVVARHFCLRYGEVLQIGNGRAPVRVDVAADGRRHVCITFMQRKYYSEPVEVTRTSICNLQGRALCSVCVVVRLRRDVQVPNIFSGITYAESLGMQKIAAGARGFASAASWGTHAFRRGWATECLQAGGPTALFYSGGWRGLTAFAYASARARGAIAAAEFLVDHSDSSEAGE